MALYNQYPFTNFHELNLDWVLQNMKKVMSDIEEVNTWKDGVASSVADLTARADKLEADYVALETSFATFTQRVEDLFDERSAELNVQFQVLRQDLENVVNDLRNQVYAIVNQLRAEVDAALEFNQTWVDARLSQFLASLPDYTQIMIHNPVKGYLTTVQEAIDDLYDVTIRTDGLTAAEYDNAGLTAEGYDRLQLTASQYDLYGSRYIITNNLFFMYSPFTGELVTVKDVIYSLAERHKIDALTASEYDSKELTAADYDALQLSAYNYDWDGKNAIA